MEKRSFPIRKKENRWKAHLLDADDKTLENARLLEENQHLRQLVEERDAELAVIQRVQEGLVSKLDMQAIYDLVGDKIREIFHNTDVEIRIYDPRTNLMHFPYFIDDGKRITVDPIPLTDSGISSYILRTGQTLVLNENLWQEAEKFGSTPILSEQGHLAKSGLFVPLVVNHQARGLLVLGDVEREHAFSASDVRLLETLANSMSTALENARLFDETQDLLKETEQRAAELAIINSVQEGLASKLDVQAIYDLVGNKIREVFKTESTLIALYDRKKNEIQFPYVIDETGKRFDQGPKPLSTGLSAHIIKTKVPLVINQDFEKLQAKLGARPFDPARPPKAYLGVPMLVGQDVVGVVALSNLEENTFNDSDVRLLTTIANSMSVALENARLFDETQRLLKETEQRNAELALINSVQSALAARLDIQGIYDAVGDRLREIFDRADVGITIYDEKTNLIHIPYDYESGQRVMVDSFALDEQGFLAHVLRTRETMVINENMAQEMEKYGSTGAIAGTVIDKSLVHVPLIAGDRARGIISIKDSQHEHAFSDSDVRLLTTITNSMSVALENARLFDETQRLLKETEQRNAELAIINSVQQGLAAELDFQALVDLVGDKLRQVFGNSDVTIGIYDPKTDFGSVPYIVENGQRLHIEPFKIEGRGFTGEMIRNPRRILINQNLVQEMEKIDSSVLPGTSLAKSMLDVPLVVGGVLRGKLQLQDMNKEHAFTDSDVRLLETIASSMSVALENARLFDETQRLLKETEEHNAELAIITSVQRALASKLEMQAIYDLVGDKVRDVFDAQGVGISYYDRATNFIRFPYCLFRGERITEMDFELGKGLTSHIIQSRQPLLINEDAAERYKELGAIFAATESEDTAKSWLGVPLIAGGQVTGVIQLENYEREFAYSDSDVRLLTTLANSMSVALENARLFDEVQKKNAEITEALERETASNDILRVIAASPTDIKPVLEVIARNAAQLSGAYDAIITLRAGDILRVDAHYGDIPTFPIGEGFPFNRDSVAGRAILEGRPVQAIHNQRGVKSEYPEGDKAARKYGYHMSCAVPLMREGKAIGAISIRRINPELLTEKQIALIQPFANQAAIAVENVRLFNETTRLLKETEQRNAELAIINSVQAGLASKLDIQAIYDLVGDKLSEIFDAPAVFISNYDLAANRAYYPYYSIERKRISLEPRPPSGAALEIIRTRQPVFLQHDAEKRLVEEYKMPTIPGTPDAESYLLMPMIVGSHVKGGIGVMSTDRKHPLDDSSVRLLQTIASSMSVALENARLFDETQRLFLEAKEARAAAEQADQAKSAFLSSMSHELRTPLNAIINFVEMIARGMIGPVNQEQVELLDQALHSSKHLLNLINDVLDISKIQAGQLTLFIEDQVSVQVEVDATLSIVGGLLQEKGLQLIRDIDPHLPMISCDRRRVRQVLLNLISNAVKFTNEGTVTVSVKNQGQAVLFAVIDTGPGIPLAKQNLIFEPFLQAEDSERQAQGTGLGLPISRSLVRAHGGELWVDSQPGEGSAFFFTLPVVRRRTL